MEGVWKMTQPAPRRPTVARRLTDLGFVFLGYSVLLYLGMRLLTGSSGVAHIGDQQVAVVLNHATGSMRPILAPGFQPHLPYVQEVLPLDRSPIVYRMEGHDLVDWNHVPRLLVRASDGSSFWFDNIEVQYTVNPEDLEEVIADSGPQGGFSKGLMNAFARSILRDEFGRYSPAEIVLPENRQAATQASRERLTTALDRHGVVVLDLSVSKPMFAEKYEQTIERRKVAEQDIESLRRKGDLFEAGSEQRQQQLRRSHELALEQARGKWELELIQLSAQAEDLEATRANRLLNIDRDREYLRAAAQAKWEYELAELVQEGTRLRAEHEQRVAELEQLHGLELDQLRHGWARDLAKQAALAESLAADRERRLDAVRREHERTTIQARAQWSERLAEVDRETATRTQAAEQEALSRLAKARAIRDAKLLRAVALEDNARLDAEGRLAKYAALADHGALAVRAAWIAKLQSIPFRIAPQAPLEKAQ